MKQGLVRLLYNFGKRFMGWTLHMIMCVLLCYPVSIHMSRLLSTGRPISSFSVKQCGMNIWKCGKKFRKSSIWIVERADNRGFNRIIVHVFLVCIFM